MKGAVMNLSRARGYVGGLKKGKGKSGNFTIISEDARIIKNVITMVAVVIGLFISLIDFRERISCSQGCTQTSDPPAFTS